MSNLRLRNKTALPKHSSLIPSGQRGSKYLLVNFGGGHGQVVQILGITISFIHAATRGDAMLLEVGAGAPVGVVLHTTAAQLLTGKGKESKCGRSKTMFSSLTALQLFKEKHGPSL